MSVQQAEMICRISLILSCPPDPWSLDRAFHPEPDLTTISADLKDDGSEPRAILEDHLLRHLSIVSLLDKMASTSRSGRNRIFNCLMSSVALLSGSPRSLREEIPPPSWDWTGEVVGKRASMKLTMHTRLR